MSMISRVPSSRWDIVNERMTSSVTTPPAFLMTCASPSTRLRSAPVSSRASMHTTAASFLAGGIGSDPLVKLFA
jgi:hypothetical protein